MSAQRSNAGQRPVSVRVDALGKRWVATGLADGGSYVGFQAKADGVKHHFVAFLIDGKLQGRRVPRYRPAANGVVLQNWGALNNELLPLGVDRERVKQCNQLTGRRIPKLAAQRLREERPDHVDIMLWDLSPDVTGWWYIHDKGGILGTVPELGRSSPVPLPTLYGSAPIPIDIAFN